jgi:hypothetical protein
MVHQPEFEMDRRERERLRDQIDKGTLEAGIHKIEDPEGFKKEEKLPAYKGARWGFAVGFAVAWIYISNNTPPALGFYPGNLTLVFIVCMGLGSVAGALFMWLFSRSTLKEKTPPHSN